MDSKNLFEYILHSNPKDRDLLQLIKFNVINKIYYYGDHFRSPTPPSKYIFLLKAIFEGLYALMQNIKVKKSRLSVGLSSGYNDPNNHLQQIGLSEERMVSSIKRNNRVACDFGLFIRTKKIMWSFAYRDFNYLVSNEFLKYIKDYLETTERFVKANNYHFLIVSNDIDFFSRLYLKIFKQLKKPSFIFMHGGLPNIYDGIMDNGSDYIVSWGGIQNEAYVKMGFDKKKMYISGHPFYRNIPKKLNFSFENILILTKSLNGVCPLEKPHLEDRGNAILYLQSIRNVLINNGITQVRLRPHPSERSNWYLKFLDNNFFKIDTRNLKETLKDSTLVIGPVSTTIIDTMHYEVNYIVYEPTINGKTVFGYDINPPLDGSDERIPIARSENELKDILMEKKKIDISCYEDYAPQYNIDFLKDLI